MSDAPVVTRRKLSVIDYHKMAEAEILTETDRVELIDGEIIEMMPIGPPHYGTVNWLTRTLVLACGDAAVVSVQNPIHLDGYNEPEPDFAVLRPRPDFYRGATISPTDVLLLIEVADSSLRFDRSVKLPLYARHGIPEVWIVNLVRQRIELFRDPDQDGYNTSSIHGPSDTLTLALAPDITIPLAQAFG